MFKPTLKDLIGMIVGIGAISGLFAWLLQKPHGLQVVVVSLLATCFALGLQVSVLQRELKKMVDQQVAKKIRNRLAALTQSNQPVAGKAGIARLLTIEHHCPGLPEPGRSTSK